MEKDGQRGEGQRPEGVNEEELETGHGLRISWPGCCANHRLGVGSACARESAGVEELRGAGDVAEDLLGQFEHFLVKDREEPWIVDVMSPALGDVHFLCAAVVLDAVKRAAAVAGEDGVYSLIGKGDTECIGDGAAVVAVAAPVVVADEQGVVAEPPGLPEELARMLFPDSGACAKGDESPQPPESRREEIKRVPEDKDIESSAAGANPPVMRLFEFAAAGPAEIAILVAEDEIVLLAEVSYLFLV